MSVEQGIFMAELDAREAGRHIAEIVPQNRIQKAGSVPEAILRAHIASEHTARRQGLGTTTLEPYEVGRFPGSEEAQKRRIVMDLGKIGEGDLNVLAYRLNQIERGAGEYATSIARRLTTKPEKSLSTPGTIQKALEEEALKTLHMRAGSNVENLRAGMTEAAREIREETHRLVGNPYEKYKVEDRIERISDISDSREPVITGSEVFRILQDLASEGQYRLVGGYRHLADLFTGALKGAQERMYLDRQYIKDLRRSEE